MIRGCARETDVVARFGGDEFALILPGHGPEGAVPVAERIRDRLRASQFPGSDGLSVRLTASIGVATLRTSPHRPKNADERPTWPCTGQGSRQGRHSRDAQE